MGKGKQKNKGARKLRSQPAQRDDCRERNPPPKLLIYGATGYTGQLTANHAHKLGMQPILCGRNRTKLEAMSTSSGFDYRVASSEDRFGLDLAIRDVDVVLNIAGPFSRTAAVIVDTCLRHGVHYLDVTGEIEVMQQLASRHQSALTEGVMIMPGTGFAVVPSDCRAAKVSELVPDARNLCIGINSANFVSRGTAKTMVEMISSDIVIRRNGQLCRVPFGSIERNLDYGEGPRLSTAMSWGDVFTAFYTTGIRNIDVYLEAEPWQNAVYQYTSAFSWLLKTRPWQYLLELQAEALPEVPTSPLPGRVIVAEAVGEAGNRAVARLRTDDGYSFSAVSSLAIAQRVLAGEYLPGYQTPAAVYGPDFVLELEGVEMELLETHAA